MTTVGSNTKLGIEYAQQGHKEAALAYLRRAVTTEPINAEVWLWLAHLTPNLEEYRHCVNQALILAPEHPTALRMQQDIDYQNHGSPPNEAAQTSQALRKTDTSHKRRRRILILLNLIVLALAGGFAGQYVLNRVTVEDLEGFLPFFEEQHKQVQFAVGNEDETFRFQVEIPRTWYLADIGSPSWQEQREQLRATYGDQANQFLAEVESDISATERIEATGEFATAAYIVETSVVHIVENPFLAPSLRVLSVQNLPADYDNNSCDTMRALAAQVQNSIQDQENFIGIEVWEQPSKQCLYYIQTQETIENHPVRVYSIGIPVTDTQIANWVLVVPAEAWRNYSESLNRLFDSLQFMATTN